MILPADNYIVINKSIITELDKKILVDLYQPIIGNSAVSLYLTLLNDLEKNEFMSESLNHYHLQNIMQTSLEDIQKMRQKLEAIGLLKTYLKKSNNNNYVYVLYGPLSASEFLNHPILNMILYKNLGKIEYQKVTDAYKVPNISLKDYENISLSFDEVFTSIETDNYFSNSNVITKSDGKLVFKDEIDIDLLIEGIDNKIVSSKAFTKEVRYLINSLAFLYNIDITAMTDLIRSSLTEKGMIDKQSLRKSARNYYQFEHGGNLPSVVHNTQPDHLKTKSSDGSLKSKMIYTFENTNPYNFLKSKYKDGKIIARDLAIIESLLLDLKLTPGVVNVLVDYVLRVNNMKLNKTYIETIASHWKRLGIETVKEAMDACLKEHKKTNKKTDSAKKEVKVPEWFDQKLEKNQNKEDEEELKNLISNYK